MPNTTIAVVDSNGLAHGTGAIRYTDGSFYIGSFEHGKRQGKGQLYKNNKLVYDGEWLNDTMHGMGAYQVVTSRRYFTIIENFKYTGAFENGMRHGEGEEQDLLTRRTYKGMWVNGMKQGPMKVYKKKELILDAIYEQNEAVSGTLYEKGVKAYNGQLKNEKPHGKGKKYYSQDIFAKGEFENGSLFGKAQFISNGGTFVGPTVDGLFDGPGLFTVRSGEQFIVEYSKDSPCYQHKKGSKVLLCSSFAPEGSLLPDVLQECKAKGKYKMVANNILQKDAGNKDLSTHCDFQMLKTFTNNAGIKHIHKFQSEMPKEKYLKHYKKALNTAGYTLYIIYYSGHGNANGDLCAIDGFISLEEIRTEWKASAGYDKGNGTLLIVSDCCYSGKWCEQLKALNEPTIAIQAACGPEECAIDISDKGGSFTIEWIKIMQDPRYKPLVSLHSPCFFTEHPFFSYTEGPRKAMSEKIWVGTSSLWK